MHCYTELLDEEYKDYIKESDDIVKEDGDRVPNDLLMRSLKK